MLCQPSGTNKSFHFPPGKTRNQPRIKLRAVEAVEPSPPPPLPTAEPAYRATCRRKISDRVSCCKPYNFRRPSVSWKRSYNFTSPAGLFEACFPCIAEGWRGGTDRPSFVWLFFVYFLCVLLWSLLLQQRGGLSSGGSNLVGMTLSLFQPHSDLLYSLASCQGSEHVLPGTEVWSGVFTDGSCRLAESWWYLFMTQRPQAGPGRIWEFAKGKQIFTTETVNLNLDHVFSDVGKICSSHDSWSTCPFLAQGDTDWWLI